MKHCWISIVLLLFANWIDGIDPCADEFRSDFPEWNRTWIGPEYWANRLQDWQIADGRLECLTGAKNKPMRTVHLLSARLVPDDGDLFMEVRTGIFGELDDVAEDAATGFLIGAGGELDYRAAALTHHSYGPDGGLFAGVDGLGRLFIRDFAQEDRYIIRLNSEQSELNHLVLRLTAKPENRAYTMRLTCLDADTNEIQSTLEFPGMQPNRLIGSIALVSHPGNHGRFWYDDWTVSGSKVKTYSDRYCGPVLGTQYTLHENILKMTAQLMPIGDNDTQSARLQILRNENWETVDTARVIHPGCTAAFRVEGWDSTVDTPYRVSYRLKQRDGTETDMYWSGTVRHDPREKSTIVVAGFTGNHNVQKSVEQAPFSWNVEGVWFPHIDIVDHVAKHDPDVLFFSGDQVYEGASPTGADREHAMHDYLYKWYLFVWAFRDLMKDRPTITEPDDHDVFHPNLWGDSGRATDKDDKGGYVMPPEFVNMVERTQTSHLPDPYDPTPVEQGIGVYYTDMTYGGISFAIIEDRKFKSGCDGLIPGKQGRPDHITDPDFDTSTLDRPGLTLLGDRQLRFLRDWAVDWKQAEMKLVVSQTVFANAATHHGAKLEYLYADLDSNGWPQTGRNKALHEFRRCFAFMLGGDQHLATLIHHGIDDWNDAGWSMCVPSIANFYPRAWKPVQPPHKRFEGMPEYTGEYRDGFGNPIAVWAATNPGEETGMYPKALHDRMPGYGIIRMNKDSRTIDIECWPRYADPTDPFARQYQGWPKTIHQLDNYGRKAAAWLPVIEVSGMIDPVVQIIDESENDIVYTLRIKGIRFRPKVFREGLYTVTVGELGTDRIRKFTNIQSIGEDDDRVLNVDFE